MEEGFEPKRTVVLSFVCIVLSAFLFASFFSLSPHLSSLTAPSRFPVSLYRPVADPPPPSQGFDEEIGGRRSARPLSETLLSRYGHNGIALILDEGFTGVDYSPEFNTTFARLGMAEKGAVSVKLEVLTPGGHSSVPPKHTGIGVMSKLIVALEDSPDSPKLERGNPVLSYLNCAADHGSMSKSLKRSVRNPKRWKKLGEEMAEGDETGVTRAFLATTQAADLIGGGIKVSASFLLPPLSYHSSAQCSFGDLSSLSLALLSFNPLR